MGRSSGSDQIGCGVESLGTPVKRADLDEGVEPGLTSAEARAVRPVRWSQSDGLAAPQCPCC